MPTFFPESPLSLRRVTQPGMASPMAAALLGATLALCAPAALAQAPAGGQASPPSQAHLQQVPGYYRQSIGDMVVTALFDGVVYLPRAQLRNIAPDAINQLALRHFASERAEGFQTAVNAYLLQRGDALVLVDAGTAQCFGDGLGQIPANLRAAGYQPEQVSHVLLTHGHPDHLCGITTPDGQMAYPNATVWLDATELAHWKSDASKARFPQPFQFLFDQARAAIAPYETAGRLRSFSPEDAANLPFNAKVLATPGHTPGHSSFLFGTEGADSLLVWGDVLHYHAIQFADPNAAYEMDEDRAQATASRRTILALAQHQRWWVGGAHLPFPGLGHVQGSDSAYAWIPTEYAPMPAKPAK